MNTSSLGLFSQKGALVAKDVTPWQTFSGKGMKFHLQSYDWNGCACLSYLTMRAFLGVMKMETLICTPYAKDLPLYSYDLISAFGKRILIVEVYDTQLNPVDLSAPRFEGQASETSMVRQSSSSAQYRQGWGSVAPVGISYRNDICIHRYVSHCQQCGFCRQDRPKPHIC